MWYKIKIRFFNLVTSSAATILAYWWIVPTVLYILLRWRENRNGVQFLEILCVYGYSLSVYIPISLLWLINIALIRWVLLIIAVLLSGSVLLSSFWSAFSHDENKKVILNNIIFNLGYLILKFF